MAVFSVFKIVNLSPDRLSVHMNLRDLPVKSLNLNYGCQDVHWNPKEGNTYSCQLFQLSVMHFCRQFVSQCAKQW